MRHMPQALRPSHLPSLPLMVSLHISASVSDRKYVMCRRKNIPQLTLAIMMPLLQVCICALHMSLPCKCFLPGGVGLHFRCQAVRFRYVSHVSPVVVLSCRCYCSNGVA